MDENKSLAQSGGGLNAKATAAVRQASLPAGSHGSIHGEKKSESGVVGFVSLATGPYVDVEG
jgi:hypothetical protein